VGRAFVGGLVLAVAGCSSERPAPGDFHTDAPVVVVLEEDGGGLWKTGPCTQENETAFCHRISNARTGECIGGTQACLGGKWTPCDTSASDGGTYTYDDAGNLVPWNP
jgi:hypothetical protein